MFIKIMGDSNHSIKKTRAHFRRVQSIRKPTNKFYDTFVKVGLSAKEQSKLFYILNQCDFWYAEKTEVLDQVLKETGY